MQVTTFAVGTLIAVFAATQLFGGKGQSGSPFSSLQANQTVLVNFGQFGGVSGNASQIETSPSNVSVRAKIKQVSEPWILGTVGSTDMWINLGEANWVRVLE